MALIVQVPYTILLYSCFELLDSTIFTADVRFNRDDDYLFIFKFLQRFGASTLSLLLAQTVLYPFDTVKRNL